MAKIFDWLKPTGNPSINGYDLSTRRTFSLPCGYLGVAYSRMFIPRTKVQAHLASIVNTLPLVNQAFTRGQFVIDCYQVPLTHLYRDFNAFYAQAQESFSADNYQFDETTATEKALPSDIGYCNYAGMIQMLFHDILETIRGYALYLSLKGDQESRKVLDDHFVWSHVEQAFEKYPDFAASTTLYFGQDVHGIPNVLGALRLLDMCRYGNWYMFFKEILLHFPLDLNLRFFIEEEQFGYPPLDYISVYMYSKLLTEALYPFELQQEYQTADTVALNTALLRAGYTASLPFFTVGLFNEQKSQVVYGLVQLGKQEFSEVFNTKVTAPYLVTLWPVLAYQKIFADIYRNTFYDKVPAYAFNIDDLFGNDGKVKYYLFDDDAVGLRVRVQSMFQSRYRQFKNDMFTCLLPSSQLGDVSMVQAGDSIYNIKLAVSDLSEGDNVFMSNENLASEYRDIDDVTHLSDVWKLHPTPAFSVLVQRRAEALQKYKERYLRAGSRLKDQFISTFGKVPYYLDDKYCRYIGSMHSDLSLQAVPATNDTGNYAVGERASYGYSGTKDQVSLDIDDFSIFMCVAYYMPEADYEAFGLAKEHTYSEPFDFPVPEFENIGLHSVTRFALSVLGTRYLNVTESVKPSDDDGMFTGNGNVGFGPAWIEMKTDVDYLHGEFGSTYYQRGIFHSWVTSRGNVSMRSLSDFYISPDYLNSVFVQQQNSLIYSQDQMLCVFNWDIKVAEPLTVVGLPIWN